MTVQTGTLRSSTPKAYASDISKQYLEGMVAGIIGAATISVLILIWDTINGQPLYTPSMLGTALFGRGEELSAPESMRVSVELTLMYTWVHGLVFAVIGGIASRLLGWVRRKEPGPRVRYRLAIRCFGVRFCWGSILIFRARAPGPCLAHDSIRQSGGRNCDGWLPMASAPRSNHKTLGQDSSFSDQAENYAGTIERRIVVQTKLIFKI